MGLKKAVARHKFEGTMFMSFNMNLFCDSFFYIGTMKKTMFIENCGRGLEMAVFFQVLSKLYNLQVCAV